MYLRQLSIAFVCVALGLSACTDEGGDDLTSLGNDAVGDTGDTTVGDGDGDTGDGDGDPGDGDGDTTGDGDGDGDTTGDGDGDTTGGGGGPACMGMEAPAGSPTVGQQASHWTGFTSDGEDWDYCEMQGTPFLLVISGAWCGPCNDLAAGMAGQASSFDVAPIIAGLENGTLGFVEVLLDNFNDFGEATVADLQAWENMYPNEYVHLLGDSTPGQDGTEPLWIYLGPVHMGGVPAAILIDADFNIEVTGMSESLAAAAANYGG
ncbi:hypothetical protein DB30_01140 [Enhygromyxa salina]|uniref:Thioredoxin domain-containing protein n=1 Tax=Enhygromyxa salina TaxID=215803 RepID=A0A0C2CXV5_9BACT|nr:hypothetical protein [Enhygromyxa salina]KIG12652.1 hypothetical protein DB30_01140 [Enhygromyxa salina]